MKPLNIAICEDDAQDLARLMEQIEAAGMEYRCHAFESCEAFLERFRPGDYELIILDIYMAGMKGVEAASAIRRLDREVVLAFCTSSRDHALDSYRLGALKYLEKPLDGNAVRETLALAEMKRQARKKISLLAGGQTREIDPQRYILF